ncbi:MAG: thioredoxin-like domain-containing protein [Chloroflexi bacterium]|nr:thioredoxin-like domain-containing protein [Chloroflexota bacterium]MCY4246463.1 thioredoxin-like domain-containing protein [Chloroflexota bacterium]
MKKWTVTALILLLLTFFAQAQRTPEELYENEFPAPEFAPGLDWINVDEPLTMAGLQGKIVILDFWTYGCVNCLHIIPVLERIETKFADEVVVIGVHSAKFENEGQTENLRQIVQRYAVHHPVVNDNEFVIWRSYGVNAWPTVAIINPRGKLVVRQAGEIPFEAFDTYLTGMIEYFDGLDESLIDRSPLQLALEGASDPGTPLLFPGKVLADAASSRLFIADSSHNRIVIVDMDTHEVLDIIGSGARGFTGGTFDEARFDKPQGMALDGDWLYIADVNNHAIRLADLAAREVMTLAGNGSMGISRLPFGQDISNPLGVSLRSPWDVELDDAGRLHIAMAGTHQLYIYEPAANRLFPSVGNGREANLNGVSLADSELAQPSGLYYAGAGKLYFADSESSAIRLADFANDLVSVVAGTTANSLFDFGDIDGALGENRLQHALGIEGAPDGTLYIADTYNSRIKIIPSGETATQTLAGLGGSGGYADGPASQAEFDEPGGLSLAEGILYIADTNNHVIRTIDLEQGAVGTLRFANPEALVIDAESLTLLGGNQVDDEPIRLDAQQVAVGEGALSLQLSFADDLKINPLIDSQLAVMQDGEALAEIVVAQRITSLPITFSEAGGSLQAELTLYYCREGAEALCYIESARWDIVYETAESAAQSEIVLARQIHAPA